MVVIIRTKSYIDVDNKSKLLAEWTQLGQLT